MNTVMSHEDRPIIHFGSPVGMSYWKPEIILVPEDINADE